MGVYIKGMEMPKNCHECRLYEGDIYYCSAADKMIDISDSSAEKCQFCPLVPVPPHGRLIDADALLMRINHEGMEAYMDGVCYGVHPSQEYLYLLGEIIDDAPTIIPAEEGE